MAMKALGRCAGMSLSGSAAPPISPRVASRRASRLLIWMLGGRLGISRDWIGGRCRPTHVNSPTTASTAPIDQAGEAEPAAFGAAPARGLRVRRPQAWSDWRQRAALERGLATLARA